MPNPEHSLNQDALLCSAANSQLVIVDIQAKLTAVMPTYEIKQLLRNTNRLQFASSLLNIPVLLSEQYPKGLGPTHADIMRQLPENTVKFDKTEFSCCANNDFTNTLRLNQRKQIILVGIEAHICVLQTALELLQQGFQVFVVADAVCSRNTEHQHNALQRMQDQGITITNHESVLFEWLRSSSHREFKAISQLLS
jgi:isochorismate hydrolase